MGATSLPPSVADAADLPLAALLEAASRAPSSHNTQPWLFRHAGRTIALLADRTRALPVNDPHDRELTISCGCALLNLVVAAAAEGLDAAVQPLPDPRDEDLLACVRFAASAQPPADAALRAAIDERRTYRQPFAPDPVEPEAVRALVDAARAEGASLLVLETEGQRRRAAALVAEGDAVQWADPRWRRELAAWMHPRRRGDGLSVPGIIAPFAQALVRSIDMGRGVGARDRQRVDGSPLLAVLGTAADEPSDWLAAGRALQRVLLTGVTHGLQAAYLNQAVQVDALRPRLRELTGRAEQPQLLLCIGRPQGPSTPAPRRPLADLLVRD